MSKRIKKGTTPGGRPYSAVKRSGEPAAIAVSSKGGRRTYIKNETGKHLESEKGSKVIAKGPRSKAK